MLHVRRIEVKRTVRKSGKWAELILRIAICINLGNKEKNYKRKGHL